MNLTFLLVSPTFMRYYADWEEIESELLLPLGVVGKELETVSVILHAGQEVSVSTAEGFSFITSGVFV